MIRVVEHRRGILFGIFVVLAVLAWGPLTAKGSDTTTRWEHFSESSGCSDPYTRTPYVSKEGQLDDSERILGPFGTYFGRTVADVRQRQIIWPVPYSGGRVVRVHKAALPAFQRVAEGLSEAAKQGRIYSITWVDAFYPRTIGGSYQLSRHALGIAIDINPAQNPYREDNKLITNMPSWFVDIWKDAGFCWGGDWKGLKDPMHFSWTGPGADGDVASILPTVAPTTALRDFASVATSDLIAMAPVIDRYMLVIGDASGNGAPDVAGLRPHPDGVVLDIASGSGGFDECSVWRWFVDDPAFSRANFVTLMDVDGDSRQDLVGVELGSGQAVVRAATRRGDFEDSRVTGSFESTGISAIAGGDFDGDHIADLWTVTSDGGLTVYRGPSWDVVLHTAILPSGAPGAVAVSDRDGGDLPELFLMYQDGAGTRLDVLRFGSSWTLDQSLGLPDNTYMAIGAGDFDGDGRADFQTLDDSGLLKAYLGNTATGRPASGWFEKPNRDCNDFVPLVFQGAFFDDDSSVHQNGIEFIASQKITAGCNPPFNDMFCPRDRMTRAQAATFISRAIGLPIPTTDSFVDDDGHVLEGGINRVAEAGLTQGCNPPDNDRFCPDRLMSRAEFAAFIVRALNLPTTDIDYFTDDDGHILEGAINRLAAAGITQGCNPPVNDHFCPSFSLTRAEAATFLTRAFK